VMLFCTGSPSARQRSITAREVTPSSRARSFTLIPFLATGESYGKIDTGAKSRQGNRMSLIDIARQLGKDANRLRFGAPVEFVYNPLDYAWEAHAAYLQAYGRGTREVLLLGMNPGPWGMAQTGVPFGEVRLVRDWLGMNAAVRTPKRTHPRVPVTGFACHRSEVSGLRLWGWARATFQTPQAFFERFFVANYCPLMFLEKGGRNLTPDKLALRERERLLQLGDAALRRLVECLQPSFVVGVGGFAESRARAALEGLDVVIGRILHPSPASPAANRDWAAQASKQLATLGISLPK